MQSLANVQLLLSGALLLLALGLLKRSPRGFAWTAAVLAGAVLALLLWVLHFVADYFTGEGVNAAAIYHLRYGLSGAGFAEYWGLVLAAAAAVAGFALLLAWASTRTATLISRAGPLAAACAALSLAVHPAGVALYRLAWSPAWAAAAVGGPALGELQREFNAHYAQPAAVRRDGSPRNLVLVYAESLERGYFDEARFPGLMRELRALEKQAHSFTAIEQVSGTSWTIAGMVASQCGIPLQASDSNSMAGADQFLPAATCMGDLLKREGYRLAYYGGARMNFAGKGKFYETHGFTEVAGRDELRGRLRDPAYLSAWGLYDDSLFELAYEKVIELARGGGRFALVMLTLDTHHPEGHPSAACRGMPYGDGSNPMLNAVRCSDHLIARFVQRIQASPAGKDTVVVVASDHLAMRNTVYEALRSAPRRNLFLVFDPRTPSGREIAVPGSTLDVGPTVMAAKGYDARIGLGTSLLDVDAAALERGARIRTRLDAWTPALAAFWRFPVIERQIEIEPDPPLVRIDGRSFAVPSFIGIDAGMQTRIQFPEDAAALDLVRSPAGEQPFLLLASCTRRDVRLPAGRLCLFSGRGREIRSQLIIDQAVRFTPEQIRRMTGA